MKKILVFWLAVLMLYVGAMVLWWAWSRRGAPPPPAAESVVDYDSGWKNEAWLKSFVLVERSNQPFNSNSLRGKVWVAGYFFASCPSVCRRQNEVTRELVREFGPRGVVFVSLTCDPANDTPAVLREYAARFDAPADQWLFLTGDLTHLRRVGAEMFQLAVDKESHGTSFALMDREGQFARHYDWKDEAKLAELRAELTRLTRR